MFETAILKTHAPIVHVFLLNRFCHHDGSLRHEKLWKMKNWLQI